MKHFFPLLLALIWTVASAQPARDIGDITVAVDARMVSVHVSANTPELNTLALEAFRAHGRYQVVPSGGQFDIKFTQLAPTQVRVDVTKGATVTPVHSQVVTGTSPRNALLRAADVAVEKTNGLGLRGFFASRLAFVGSRGRGGEIFVGDLFFGEVRQLTQDRAQMLSPRWSPDGSRLVYTSFYKSGFPDIFQIDLNTYQRTTLVSLQGTNSGARFSPNGQQLAMVLSGEGNPEIYVGNAQGRLLRRLTRTDAVEASPCFSPDGSRLVFTSDAVGGPQLYTMSVAGGTMTRLPTAISGYCAEPDWSRGNPNRIAFTMRIGKGYQIAVYDLATHQSQRVSHAPFDGLEPSWLADGRHLVYTARTASDSRICILDTETGKSTTVAPPSLGPTMQASVHDP
jgi:TolB protein